MKHEMQHLLLVEDTQFQKILQSGLATAQQEVKVANLAHDFNNILTVISLYSQMLRQNPTTARPDEFLAKIDLQTKSAAQLVTQILDLSAHAGVQAAPAAADPAPEARAASSVELLPGGNETLLIVEDEGAVRDALLALFRGLGYTVLVAADGEAAVSVFEAAHGGVDLVLSDMVMPGMSGAELYVALRRRKPDLKMILSSGYPLNNLDRTLPAQGVSAWIQKPYPIEAIAQKVRIALDMG